MDFTHRGKISHLCNICGKMFFQESSLKAHILSSHQTDGGTYKCDHCSNSYFTMRSLQHHLMVHRDINTKKSDTK